MIDDAFANVLKRLRKESGLSQETLAHEAGFHRTYISQLERGKKSPTLRTLYTLSLALDINLEEFARLIQSEAESVSSQ